MELLDSYGRRINYLRLSVTDRCNLRCHYCMPAEGVPKLQHQDVLRYEALGRVVTEAVALGIKKVRITGGEPLVRKGLVEFIAELATIPGLKEIALTTNGTLLRQYAEDLRRAGVHRLNISLDSLKSETFAAITRGGDLNHVLDGIAAAEEAGFAPIKINMVVMRGVNDAEILGFAALTLHKAYAVRFIEYMPAVAEQEWQPECVAGSEILDRIRQRYPLMPLKSGTLAGPAQNFAIPGSLGAIGVITPMSNHFCQTCNRIRLTASGLVKGCLFSGEGVDLKPCLASGDSQLLRETLRRVVSAKPVRHELGVGVGPEGWVAMSQIGG